MKSAVGKGERPIYDGFEVLADSLFSKADYRMRGPVEEWGACSE